MKNKPRIFTMRTGPYVEHHHITGTVVFNRGGPPWGLEYRCIVVQRAIVALVGGYVLS
jgi:hypothetical protein